MKLFICATLLLASVSQFASADLIAGIVNLFDGFKVPGTDVELLGCFNDGSGGFLQPPRVFSGGFKEYKETEVLEKCYKDAVKNGVNTFAIQFGKQCFANDKNAEGHYSKLGRPLIAVCMDGRGGFLQNDVYHIKTAAGGYKHVGCFKDNIFDRAVPGLDGKYETLKDNYQDRANAIHKCYEVAKKEGLKVFAVQHGGWCAGSKDMEAYKKYGSADNCKDGRGGGSSNDVYTIDGAAPPATEAPLPATTGMCPKSHPNAYLKGTHCCSSGFEKVAERDGDLCDGSAIGFTSKCCKNDGYAACPKGVCGNYKAPPTPAPTPPPVEVRAECPDNGHMYPGDNLENPAASSWQECANHCGQNSKCKAFTFTVATKRCSLKAVIKQVKVKEGKISGSYLCAAKMADWTPTSAPVPIRPVTQAPVTAPPAITIKHVDPVPATPAAVKHEKVASGRCKSVDKEDCRRIATDVYKMKMKEGTRTYGKYPAGCYVVTSSGTVAFNADQDKKGTHCTAQRNCLCSEKELDVTFAANKGNLECSNYSAQGCYAAKKSFTRDDSKLLVYWRHDITWSNIRAFTKSMVCTCAKAAKAAGVKYYAIHFWGECWAVNMDNFNKNNGGDCMRDVGKKCNGNDKRMCLADKHFQVYKTA